MWIYVLYALCNEHISGHYQENLVGFCAACIGGFSCCCALSKVEVYYVHYMNVYINILHYISLYKLKYNICTFSDGSKVGEDVCLVGCGHIAGI
jgi:hypothetical protein